MQTLTDNGCSDWLASRKLLANPYGSPDSRHSFCDQFPLPNTLRVSSLFRSILDCIGPFEAALLHVTDWTPYDPDEMAVVAHVRQAFGELRPMIESPGHVFAASEHHLLVGLLSLVTSYGWTAYVYFDHGVTLFSWEGDLLDFYCSDAECYRSVCDAAMQMGISSNATGNA